MDDLFRKLYKIFKGSKPEKSKYIDAKRKTRYSYKEGVSLRHYYCNKMTSTSTQSSQQREGRRGKLPQGSRYKGPQKPHELKI